MIDLTPRKMVPCDDCDGKGEVRKQVGDRFVGMEPCTICRGSGKVEGPSELSPVERQLKAQVKAWDSFFQAIGANV